MHIGIYDAESGWHHGNCSFYCGLRMADLFDATLSYLESEGWPHQSFPSLPLIRCAFEGRSGHWQVFARPHPQGHQLSIYSLCPVEMAKNRRNEGAILLTRLNNGLRVGAFEMDMEVGSLRFKTSIAFGETSPKPQLISELFMGNVATMDTYFPVLMAFIRGGIGVSEAMAQARDLDK